MAPKLTYIDSYYSRTARPFPGLSSLDSEIDTDVCIIGGGLAGLSTALGLAERGVSCVLLESRQVGWGASGRNGGFISRGFSQDALKLAKQLGERRAQQLYSLTAEALALVKQRVAGQEDAITKPEQGTVVASWFNERDCVQGYVEEMNRIFDENLEFWPREKMAQSYLTNRYYDGYLKPACLRIHALDYVLLTARSALAHGARIFEESAATGVRKGVDTWYVSTAGGLVRANHVVYACSGYIGSLHNKLSRATLPVSTWVLLTEPLGSRLTDAIRAPYGVADNRFSSNYYRVVGEKQLLWGGRVSMYQPAKEKLKTIMLKDLLSVYPQLAGIRAEVAWGGNMGYARHKMPQIGQLQPGEWYCQGFGGHGMATTTMGGELIASAIASNDDRYRLFSPFGLSYAGRPVGPVIAQMAYWTYQLQDALKAKRLNPTQRQSAD